MRKQSRKKTEKKKAHLHAHARKRAKKRLGIELKKPLRAEIIKIIQTSNSKLKKLVLKQSLSRTVFDVMTSQGEIRVVYDTKRHAIATVLTKDMDPRDLQEEVEEIEDAEK